MDRAALQKLKRADVQKLAKRDGVKANGKTSQMIEDLLEKHHPLLVPYMDSIPPTTEQEAISRKILRRQGMTLPAPGADAGSLRRSPRRAGGEVEVEPVAGPSKVPASAAAGPSHKPSEPLEARVAEASAAKVANASGKDEPSDAGHRVASARTGFSHTSASVASSTAGPARRLQGSVGAKVAKVSSTASQSGLSSKTKIRANGSDEQPVEDIDSVQVSSTAGSSSSDSARQAGLPHAGQADQLRSLPTFGLRPVQSWSPQGEGPRKEAHVEVTGPPRVFFPPTEAQLAGTRAKAAQGPPPADRPDVGHVPVFTRPAPARSQREDWARDGERNPEPTKAGCVPASSSPPVSDTGEPAARSESPQPRPAPPVHLPSISELRDNLREIAPLADEDPGVRQGLHELNILVNVVEQHNEEVKKRVREVQKLRLALEQHFFAQLKADPRLLNGTWTRDASVEEATDEEELEEVEDLTTGQVPDSDLPEGNAADGEGNVARSPSKGSRKRPASDSDVGDDACPTKRQRRSKH
ncbi:hypothetical protein OH77DRAFT_1588578 [Trametes cingulata]|nr:hypothetical protein OH77DRAFT_1588578 [Trametes cingulata]